jgi:hypothetical protein
VDVEERERDNGGDWGRVGGYAGYIHRRSWVGGGAVGGGGHNKKRNRKSRCGRIIHRERAMRRKAGMRKRMINTKGGRTGRGGGW